MSTLFPDTHPEAEKVLIELLRQTPPWRKMEMVGQMNETVKTLMMSGLRSRYPDEPPEKLRRRLADLLLGPELAAKAYGPLE
jgi:hypothetical protein